MLTPVPALKTAYSEYAGAPVAWHLYFQAGSFVPVAVQTLSGFGGLRDFRGSQEIITMPPSEQQGQIRPVAGVSGAVPSTWSDFFLTLWARRS